MLVHFYAFFQLFVHWFFGLNENIECMYVWIAKTLHADVEFISV